LTGAGVVGLPDDAWARAVVNIQGTHHHPMKTIDIMLNQHPRALPTSRESYAEAVSMLAMCEQICVSCADACLGEIEHLHHLVRCIRLNQDCSDICGATARLLTRQTDSESSLVQAQVHVCVLACQLCADECFAHASTHGHCATCADTCRCCQESCNRLLAEMESFHLAEEGTSPEQASVR
jgi:hypothetical protein